MSAIAKNPCKMVEEMDTNVRLAYENIEEERRILCIMLYRERKFMSPQSAGVRPYISYAYRADQRDRRKSKFKTAFCVTCIRYPHDFCSVS